jgi:osomolarity two-component system phosphorelay intermediate protein YPD1
VLNISTCTSSREDLQELSSLGHFLKGSSATLGLSKVKDACEKIQHLGAGKDEAGVNTILDRSVLLSSIKQVVKGVREDYSEVEKGLKAFYGDKS